jgi:ParB family transcriptional regulator, chromosome partitioning protein
MSSIRSTLGRIEANLLESMGRRTGSAEPAMAPTPDPKDIGRRPVSNLGCVDINQVVADPKQPRTEFPAEALNRMADSIRDRGQLAPIRVRWSAELSKWVIIAGERRWRAAKLAGLSTIDCHFQTGDLSPAEILEQQLIENLLREDLKPVEQARAYAALMELHGWNGKQVAQRLRVPASQVSRALALLRLPEDIRHRVDAGEIPPRSAYEISKLDDPRQQRQLAQRAADGQLTHNEAAQIVPNRRRQHDRQPRETRLTFMTEQGWKIFVSARRKGTYYEIEQALGEALDEVRHRIKNNVQIF